MTVVTRRLVLLLVTLWLPATTAFHRHAWQAPRAARSFITLHARSLYDVLDVAPTATLAEIKRAYRRQAVKYHPDSNPDPRAKEQFIEVVGAYETLKDADKRAQYDREVRVGAGGGFSTSSAGSRTSGTAGTGADWFDARPTGEMPQDIDDSFGAIFGDFLGTLGRTAVGVAAGGRSGLLSDLVDFLEQRVDGFGAEDSSAELDDLLRQGSAEELKQELEASDTLLKALKARLESVNVEKVTAEAKLRQWQSSTQGQTQDFDSMLKQSDLAGDVAALQARLADLTNYKKRAEKRRTAVQRRLEQVEAGQSGGRKDSWRRANGESSSRSGGDGRSSSSGGGGSSGGSSGGGGSSSSSSSNNNNNNRGTSAGTRTPPHMRPRKRDDAQIDDELRRLKEKLGK